MITFLGSGPSAATIPSASRIAGNAKKTSITRPITRSTNPAKVARPDPENATGDSGRRDREQRNLHRKTRAPEHAAEEVAPESVGPERKRRAGPGEAVRRDLQRVTERQEAHGQRDHRVDRDHREAGEGNAVARDRGEHAGWAETERRR